MLCALYCSLPPHPNSSDCKEHFFLLVSPHSKPSPPGPLLLNLLLQSIVLKSLLDLLALLAQLEGQLVHVVFFVHVVPEGIVSARCCARLTVLSLCVVFTASVMTLSRLNSDVLRKELFRSEVVHKVLRCNEATILISVLEKDLIESLDHGLHDFLKAEEHCLFVLVVGADVLTELLVDLLDNTIEPVSHVRVSQVDLLAHLDGLVIQLLGSLDLDVQLMDLRIGRSAVSLNLKLGMRVRILHLQLVELLSDLLVLTTKSVKFFLVFADSMEQLRVSCLSCEEFLDDLLHIREASLSSDHLEGLLDLRSPGHLLVHLALEEGAPELLG